ncbi:hypothetical protein LJR244_004555 [Brucella pseudogrignonensis]
MAETIIKLYDGMQRDIVDVAEVSCRAAQERQIECREGSHTLFLGRL